VNTQINIASPRQLGHSFETLYHVFSQKVLWHRNERFRRESNVSDVLYREKVSDKPFKQSDRCIGNIASREDNIADLLVRLEVRDSGSEAIILVDPEAALFD